MPEKRDFRISHHDDLYIHHLLKKHFFNNRNESVKMIKLMILDVVFNFFQISVDAIRLIAFCVSEIKKLKYDDINCCY